MREHTIELENLTKALTNKWVAVYRDLSEQGDKSLEVSIGNINLKVVVNNVIIWEGIQPYKAMENYNNAFALLKSGNYLKRQNQ